MKELLVLLVFLFFTFSLAAPQSEGQDDDEEIKPYHYQYTVKDQEKQLFFEKSELGDEQGKVKGFYSVLQADGRLMKVEYEANKEDGFVPKISYQKDIDPFKD